MSEDPARYSAAPNRGITKDEEFAITPPPWTPPPPTMSRMRLMVNGEEMPFIVRGPEEEEKEALDPVAEQVQAVKEAYGRRLDRHYDGSRTDYARMKADKVIDKDMLRIHRLRIQEQRDWLHPWELRQGPGPRLAVPPPVDRRTGSRG